METSSRGRVADVPLENEAIPSPRETTNEYELLTADEQAQEHNEVAGQESDSPTPSRKWDHLFVSVMYAVVLLAVLFAHSEFSLPRPLASDSSKTSFSEERALEHLKELTDDIGTRPFGSTANEHRTVEYLQKFARNVAGETPRVNIQVSVQHADGVYTFEKNNFAYRNVSNVVVRLSRDHAPVDVTKRNALLVNSHFDSGISSPGASDDGVAVVVMMEVLRCLAHLLADQSSFKLSRPVVFLFNGAEEVGLLGSHAFVTKHPWASTVQSFVNLEGAGAGGPEVLFQAGPGNPQLAQAYSAAAPHPRGSVIGQDIFQSGVIPSDTDYRVFTKIGGYQGLDMAYYMNGYVYHTTEDKYKRVSPGGVQHMGTNVLEIIQYATNTMERPSSSSTEKGVFFDFLGVFMLAYGETWAIVFHSLSLVIVMVVCFRTFRGQAQLYPSCVPGTVLGICLIISIFLSCMATSMLMAAVIRLVNPMSWYSSTFGATFLFGASAFLGMCFAVLLASVVAAKKNIPITRVQGNTFVASLVIVAFLLLVCTICHVGCGYLLLILTLSLVASHFIASWGNQAMYTESRSWWIPFVTATFFPSLFLLDVAVMLLEMIVPLSGRLGASPPADFVIGGLIAVVFFFLAIPALPTLAGSRKIKWILAGTLALCCVLVLVFAFIPTYTQDAPKRLSFQHMYKTENGTTVSTLGLNGADSRPMSEILKVMDKWSGQTKFHYDQKIALPAVLSVIRQRQGGYILEFDKPDPPKPVHSLSVEMLGSQLLEGNKTARQTYRVQPTHLGDDLPIVQPMYQVKLTSSKIVHGWSLGETGLAKDSTSVAMALIGHAGAWEFSVDVAVDRGSGCSASLEVTATYDVSDELMDAALAKLPKWTTSSRVVQHTLVVLV